MLEVIQGIVGKHLRLFLNTCVKDGKLFVRQFIWTARSNSASCSLFGQVSVLLRNVFHSTFFKQLFDDMILYFKLLTQLSH